MKKVKLVAIAFAFTFVLIAFTAPPAAAVSRYDSLLSYMSDNYDAVRGGYVLPSDGVTRVNPTYGAFSIMDETGTILQRPPPVSIPMALDFSVKHQWLSGDPEDTPRFGGFMDYLLGPVTAATTYHGLVTWQLLKGQIGIPGTGDYELNSSSLSFWVNRTVSEDGGYASEVGNEPDLISTFYALASFRLIDETYSTENAWDTYVNETATLEWIESCKDGDAYMLSPISDRTSLTATAAAVLAHREIDPLAIIPDVSSIQSWILDRQIMDYNVPEFIGGFEEGNATDDPNILSSYFALKALDSLNGLSSINATALENFILNCQSADGSWGFVPGLETGSMVYSAYVCQILNMTPIFSGAQSTLSSSVDPHSPGTAGFDWRVLVVLGIIVVALVAAIYSVRMD
ncbi:MAG: prenyltransferase/squalene oxidase repeat-containing protein [Candidatus Thorarchaeota archaeon]